MPNKKILIIVNKCPYPAIDGTKYKILNNIADGVYQDFLVDFLIITHEKVSQDQIDYLENRFNKVMVFRISKPLLVFRMFLGLFTKLPLQVFAFYNKHANSFVKENINQYDTAYIHTMRMTEYFINLPEKVRSKVVVDMNDAFSLNYKDAKIKAKFPLNIFFSFEYLRSLKYEKKILSNFFNINIITQKDKKYVLNSAGDISHIKNFTCIPHGVPDKLISRTPVPNKNQIVFVGNLSYEPNRDGVHFFLENIWLKLKQKNPHLELIIIGGGDTSNFPKEDGVIFKGFVEDIYPYIETSALSIAPIRFGAGMLSKVTESMALGVPVITTPLGASGIEGFINEQNVIIVDEFNIDGWVNKITEVLNNPEKQKMLGHNARQIVKEKYIESSVQKQFLDLFKSSID